MIEEPLWSTIATSIDLHPSSAKFPMHDDGEDDSDDKGAIFYSGFTRDPQRADYALPRGMPALQGGDVEEELGSERPQSGFSRRSFAVACVGVGLAGAASTYMLMSVRPDAKDRTEQAPANPKPGTPEWLIHGARTAATGSLDVLVNSYGSFVMVVQDYAPHDPVLWDGIERLGKYALLHRGKKGLDIATRLTAAFEHAEPPARLARLRFELEDLVWRHRRKR